MLNVQSRGACRTGLKTTFGFHICLVEYLCLDSTEFTLPFVCVHATSGHAVG